MALKRLDIDGYGQIELNNVAFRRDGRIEAQCALDPEAFADFPAENGMLLVVDKANRIVRPAISTDDDTATVALHYSTEHLYDERTPGLKNFKLTPGTDRLQDDNFYPRMGYLAVGDLYTTNAVCYDTTEFVTEDDPSTDDDEGGQALDFYQTVKDAYKTTPYYGVVAIAGNGETVAGLTQITATKPKTLIGGVLLKVVNVYTMPDGQPGFKFQVIKA